MAWIGDLTDILDKSAFSSSKYHTGAYAYKPYLAFDNHNSTTTHDGFQIHYGDGRWERLVKNRL